MLRRYSSIVVAPITRRSPRASAGFNMLEASIEPSAAPAPTTVCSSSMNRMRSSPWSVTSSITDLRRSSNSPRYFVPATMPARSRTTSRLPASVSGTSSLTIRWAMPSAIAVFPTPGSPISTGLFFVRRERISIVSSISSARPITGSSLPWRAASVRSRLYSSSVFVWLAGLPPSSVGVTPRITAARSAVCDRPKRASRRPASDSVSRASASSTCSGPRYDEFSSRISSYARSSAALASGESDGATSVRPPRSASSSTCAAIAAGSPSAWRTICATRSSCIAAHSRCSVSRSREPHSSASCAARWRSSRVASEKNCVMSTCSTGRRAGGAEVRVPVGLVAPSMPNGRSKNSEKNSSNRLPRRRRKSPKGSFVAMSDLLARALVP